MTNKYTHLILSGGGLYGLCFLGIFRYLIIEKKLNSLKNIVGNSMGSFFSLGYSLNIDIDKLENIVKELKECNDIKINKKNLGNLFKKNGILNFSIFTNRLKIESKIDDITFKEFSKKFGINLYISATNVNRLENVIFCIDNTPDVSVFDAVAASMSLPYMCEPILIDGEYYIDGCLSNNFPSNIFQNINKNNILGITIKINRDYEIK
jgi:NTE family protein